MHVFGFNVPLTPTQALEGLVVYSSFDFLNHVQRTIFSTSAKADSKGGNIKAGTMPLLGRIVSPIHILTFLAPPMVYMGAVALNRFRQPEWMKQYALPSDMIMGVQLSPVSKTALRVVASLSTLALKGAIDNVLRHISDQWHVLGRRERPRVVQTGPYAWVRHPFYSVILLQEALSSVVFWSYIPLVTLGITAAMFVIKVPIEESVIQQDPGIREEYQAYKKKVPARLIPYIW